ncbi:MAG: recombination regulator RecX [Kocuria sp.]|nr:recombination regulator RecX [Kocuria sp.]
MSLRSGRGDGRNRSGAGRRRKGSRLGGPAVSPKYSASRGQRLESSGASEFSVHSRSHDVGQSPETAEEKVSRPAEEKTEYEQAKDIVLRQLTMAARSRAELEDKLRSKQIGEETITEILDKYEDWGLVNDQEFAEMFVRSRATSRKLARPALRRELADKGITGDIAEEALAQRTDEDEREDARALVRKKIKRGADLNDRTVREKELRRLASMLARRGYSPGVAFDVAKQELHIVGEEEFDDLP